MLILLLFSAASLVPSPQAQCPDPPGSPTVCLEDPDFSDLCLPTRAVDGLLNGNFDLICTDTSLGTAHTPNQSGHDPNSPADAGYWVGGEGMTVKVPNTSNRFLRISPGTSDPAQLQRLVYQRVGAPNEVIASCVSPQNPLELMTLNAKLRLGQNGDEARVTIAECDGRQWELAWFLGNTPSPFNYVDYPDSPPADPTGDRAFWHFEVLDLAVDPDPFEMCYSDTSTSSVIFFAPPSPATSCSGLPVLQHRHSLEATGNYVLATLDEVNRDAVLISKFKAPETGCIRVGTRVWTVQGNSNNLSGCLLKVFRVPAGGGAPQLVRQIEVPAGDTDGAVVLDRICVREDDEIEFHVSRLDVSKPAYFLFNPAIVYEGRRLTYRFTKALPAPTLEGQCPSCSSCKCNANEKFKSVLIPTAVGQWSSLLQLNVGSEWMIKWPGSPPNPPLEVELSAHPGNPGAVDFDDVKLNVHYWDASPAELEAEIQSYIGWARTISSYQRDRCSDPADTIPPFDNNEKGNFPSPYVTWNIKANDGVSVPLGTDVGQSPEAWERLSVDFDCQDYDDQFALFEAAWAHRYATTGLVYDNYDCLLDEYLGFSALQPPCDEDFNLTSLDSLRARVGSSYDDVAYLDIAAAYAQAIADHAVLSDCPPPPTPPSWWAGLITPGPVRVCGSPWPQCGIYEPGIVDPLSFMTGTAEFLRVYCAVKRWQLEHPLTPRFSTPTLSSWLSTLRTSVGRAMNHIDDNGVLDVPGDLCTGGTWWTNRDWHGLSYYFNDLFGALGAAGGLYAELDALPGSDEDDIVDSLECLVTQGVQNWLVPWFECNARGDHSGGDQVKAWKHFHQHPDLVAPSDSNIKSSEQLERAARYWLKFQYPGGTWINVGEGLLQLTNLSGGAPSGGAGQPAIPPHAYIRGFMMAIDVTADPVRKDEMRDILYTVLRTTRLKFRDAYLSTSCNPHVDLKYGFATRAPGYPNYPPTPCAYLQNLPSGGEARLIDNILLGLKDAGMDDVTGRTPVAPPVVDVFEPHLGVEPSSPEFHFVLSLPNASDLHDALHQRTRIGWWRFVGTDWTYEQLWPEPPGAWLDFQEGVPYGNTIGLEATLVNPANNPFHDKTFKIEMHSWDLRGQWDRDTSYQEW